MRCNTNCSRAANALFISFFWLCLLHAPANKQDFHHKNDLFLPKTGENARCKRGVNCVRDGQKCLILQGKSAFVRGLPRHTKSILIKCDQPPGKPVSVPSVKGGRMIFCCVASAFEPLHRPRTRGSRRACSAADRPHQTHARCTAVGAARW